MLVGDYAGARSLLLEAYQRATDMHYLTISIATLSDLGSLCEEVGEDEKAKEYCQQILESAGGHHHIPRANTLCTLGHLYRRQGQWDAATDVYQQALTLNQEVNRAIDTLICQTYLAAVTLERGEPKAALNAVEPLLNDFANTRFSAEHRPQSLLLIFYQILNANQDPRANAVLQQGWAYVQDQVAKLEDPAMRHTFLNNVPFNRQLAQLISEIS